MRSTYSLGKALASRNMALVYGGANPGLMGALAEGVLESGGIAIGIIARSIVEKGLEMRGLSKLEVVADLSQRKSRMNAISDAFIALPGGYGTLDELFEVAALNQTGTQKKPIALLNVNHFYDPLVQQLSVMESSGLARNPERNHFIVSDDIDAILDAVSR